MLFIEVNKSTGCKTYYPEESALARLMALITSYRVTWFKTDPISDMIGGEVLDLPYCWFRSERHDLDFSDWHKIEPGVGV